MGSLTIISRCQGIRSAAKMPPKYKGAHVLPYVAPFKYSSTVVNNFSDISFHCNNRINMRKKVNGCIDLARMLFLRADLTALHPYIRALSPAVLAAIQSSGARKEMRTVFLCYLGHWRRILPRRTRHAGRVELSCTSQSAGAMCLLARQSQLTSWTSTSVQILQVT